MEALLPKALSLEAIASGLVGLLLLGVIVKRVFDGYVEARKNLQKNPMVTAAAAVWDQGQQERFLQLFERMVMANEKSTGYLAELASRQTHDMQEQLEYLVSRIDAPRKRPRRPKVKA